MRFLDGPLAISLLSFAGGTLAGAVAVQFSSPFRFFTLQLVQVRMLSPLKFALLNGGQFMVLLLIFANNSTIILLSFLYPFLIVTVHWNPPLGARQRSRLLAMFTLPTAFVVGFFGLGGILSLEWLLAGATGVLTLLSKSWLHGPVELGFILVCVSEPLRLARAGETRDIGQALRNDAVLLAGSLIALLAAAAAEVYAMV